MSSPSRSLAAFAHHKGAEGLPLGRSSLPLLPQSMPQRVRRRTASNLSVLYGGQPEQPIPTSDPLDDELPMIESLLAEGRANVDGIDTWVVNQPPTTILEKDDATEKDNPPALSSIFKEMPSDAVLWLNAVAIIWGSQHAVIKLVVDDSDTSAFSLTRFALAAGVATLPLLPSLLRSNLSTTTDESATTVQQQQEQRHLIFRWGAEMGLWVFLGYAFQAIGLEFTTAQRSGFLLYLNVKFVPFFARFFLGRQISWASWASAATAVVGTALLATTSDGNVLQLAFNVGDAWSIAAAATSAMFILRLEAATAAVSNSAALNAASLWCVTGAALLWSLGQGFLATDYSIGLALHQVAANVGQILQRHWVELLYLSAVTTTLATYIQTRAQKKVSAERASVIYSMDPVYGAIFSNVLLGETLQGLGILGASLITLAAVTNVLLDLSSNSSTTAATDADHKKHVNDDHVTKEI